MFRNKEETKPSNSNDWTGTLLCHTKSGTKHRILQERWRLPRARVPPQQKKGTRSDLDDFKATVKEGVTCMKTLRDMHSEVCAKYPQFVADYVIDWREKQPVTTFPLRPWQSDLYQKLIVTPTSGEELIKFQREINFIVDHTGNQGKSWFCRYYCDRHDNAQIIVPGKKADMARVIREDCRVFFFDCPRSKQGEFIQYDLLEELKTEMCSAANTKAS